MHSLHNIKDKVVRCKLCSAVQLRCLLRAPTVSFGHCTFTDGYRFKLKRPHNANQWSRACAQMLQAAYDAWFDLGSSFDTA